MMDIDRRPRAALEVWVTHRLEGETVALEIGDRIYLSPAQGYVLQGATSPDDWVSILSAIRIRIEPTDSGRAALILADPRARKIIHRPT